METTSARALRECIAELRAACRRPIDEAALAALLARLRPQFEHVLDNPDGPARWMDHGWQMRDHGRYIGGIADLFAYQSNVAIVGTNELFRAFAMIEVACRVGAEATADDFAR